MATLDWLIVGAYCVAMLVIGVIFAKRAGKSIESYFVAGRKLPWWIIGFSAVATYSCAGAAPVFTMLVYDHGLLGNWTWWLSYAIWMPMVAVVWAKLWRRMGIVTTAEFVHLRYGGSAARIYRSVYALFLSLFWAILINGYVFGCLGKALGPITQWPSWIVIVISAVFVLIYCGLSGLLGVVYSDVVQFLIFMAGNIVLIVLLLDKVGGLGGVLETATKARGEVMFQATPPGTVPGTDFSIGIGMMFMFLVQGLFFAIGPSQGEGYTAQRFLAARNEFHAQVGQLFNAFMTLIVRVLPFMLLGFIGIALIKRGEVPSDEVWGTLVSRYSVVGLTGLIVAAEFAALMSTIDTHTNWGASFFVNDIVKVLWKNASQSNLVWMGRLFTALILGASVLIGITVTKLYDWFFFVNGVAISFLMPLAWLRFFWWRTNIWGELVGLVVGIPLSVILWFVVGLGDTTAYPPFVGFFILFSLGWIAMVATTLLTRREPTEKLIEFYKRCRPPGFWGPVIKAAGLDIERQRSDTRRDIVDCVLGVAACVSSVVVMTALFGRHRTTTAIAIAIFVVSATVFALRWARRARKTELTQESAS